MGSMSLWHWIIVAIIIILLFGRGRISDVMGDLAKGIKSFKQGLADDTTEPPAEPKRISHHPHTPAPDLTSRSEQPSPGDDRPS